MKRSWKWLRVALLVLPLALLTAALLVWLDPPRKSRGMDWLLWMTLSVPLYTWGSGGCGWLERRFHRNRPRHEDGRV